MSDKTFRARLAAIEDLSDEVRSFRFEALTGAPFADATPGAHVDVHLGDGLIKQYSLWTWDSDGMSGTVAVKREDDGKGGSKAMHALTVGREVDLAGPRNNFPLDESAPHSILLAGGIGATPIYAMAARLAEKGASVEVYYMARSRDHAAFQEKFEALGLGDAVRCRHDDTDGFLDLDAVMREAKPGSHVYICGPGAMLDAALAAGERHLPKEQVHFERFSADPKMLAAPGDTFIVELAQSGQSFEIPADKTILEVFQANAVPADFGCSEGVCGTCITDVLEGEIDHRDQILTDDERADGDIMCICVSRAKGGKLVLDM
jgi:ferredoxin-NADP reductase